MTFLAEGGVTGGKAAFNANALGDRVPPCNAISPRRLRFQLNRRLCYKKPALA
jgi:hypothetical protein